MSLHLHYTQPKSEPISTSEYRYLGEQLSQFFHCPWLPVLSPRGLRQRVLWETKELLAASGASGSLTTSPERQDVPIFW